MKKDCCSLKTQPIHLSMVGRWNTVCRILPIKKKSVWIRLFSLVRGSNKLIPMDHKFIIVVFSYVPYWVWFAIIARFQQMSFKILSLAIFCCCWSVWPEKMTKAAGRQQRTKKKICFDFSIVLFFDDLHDFPFPFITQLLFSR